MMGIIGAVGLDEDERSLVTRTDALARDGLVALADAFGEQHATSRPIVERLAAAGLFRAGVTDPVTREAAPVGYSMALCLIREVLGYHHPTLDISFALQGLGTGAIVRLGSDSQRRRYLPDLLEGRTLFAFGLSEPEAGSDVLGMTTTARREGDEYVLHGTKMWISGAPDADVYVVFARTDDRPRGRGISAFIIEKGTPGFRPRADLPLSSPHAIGHLDLDGCRVPVENRIGEEGEGLSASLGTLEVYRPSVGAYAVGAAQRAVELAIDFARTRPAFGAHLIDLEGVRLMLVRSLVELEASRHLVYRAARLNDSGEVNARDSGIAKLGATETAIRAIYRAQQVHGGRGVLMGNHVEALARNVRATTIYEGASEVQRLIIGRHESKAAVASESAPGAPDLRAIPTGGDSAFERVARAEALVARMESATLSQARAMAAAASPELRRQATLFRLADVRVAIEGARSVADRARALQDGPDGELTAAFALSATVRASATVGQELLELNRMSGQGLRAAAGALLLEGDDSADALDRWIADRVLGPSATLTDRPAGGQTGVSAVTTGDGEAGADGLQVGQG